MPQQVLRDPRVLTAIVAARPEPTTGSGLSSEQRMSPAMRWRSPLSTAAFLLGQAADRDAKFQVRSPAAEALTEAELNDLLSLQRRELASGLGQVGHQWTVGGAWRDSYRLVNETGATSPVERSSPAGNQAINNASSVTGRQSKPVTNG